MSKISKTSWAYAAGILDGEGCICISENRQISLKGTECKRYDLDVWITNTDERLIKWFSAIFGGRVKHAKRRQNNPSWKDCHYWNPSSREQTKKFLLAVLPYLHIKREQAIIALQFIDLGSVENPETRKSLYVRCRGFNSSESPTTNTLNDSFESKIESNLHGDV